MRRRRRLLDTDPAFTQTPFAPARALAIILALMLPVFAGCGKPPEKARRQAAVNVRVQKVETRSLRPFVESIGSLAPERQVTVSSELDGILDSITVNEGDTVKKGQEIARIRPTDYRLALEQASAQLAQSEVSLANLRQEYRRKQELYKEELLTRQHFDDITARVGLAEAETTRSQAAVSIAKERLGRTRIFSPISGSIGEKRVTTGDYVRNGAFLTSVVRTDLLKLIFSVSEKDAGHLRPGQDIEFITDAFADRRFKGRLCAILPSLDERTRTLKAEALVANGDNSLKPGFFARVTLYTGPARKRVVVPVTSLLYDNATTRLFVVEGDKARERIVKPGGKYGETMEITEGVKDGDTIVTVGQNNLMEGATIHVAR